MVSQVLFFNLLITPETTTESTVRFLVISLGKVNPVNLLAMFETSLIGPGKEAVILNSFVTVL